MNFKDLILLSVNVLSLTHSAEAKWPRVDCEKNCTVQSCKNPTTKENCQLNCDESDLGACNSASVSITTPSQGEGNQSVSQPPEPSDRTNPTNLQPQSNQPAAVKKSGRPLLQPNLEPDAISKQREAERLRAPVPASGPIENKVRMDAFKRQIAGYETEAMVKQAEKYFIAHPERRYEEKVVFDYVHYLALDEIHKTGLTGKGIKVSIMDSWFDYKSPQVKAFITESTQERTPTGVMKKNNEYNMYRAQGHHANHVTGIIHTVAPGAKLSFINWQGEDVGFEETSETGSNLMVKEKRMLIGLSRPIASRSSFINLSLELRVAMDNKEMKDTFKQALISLAQHGIGIIIGLGNEQKSSQEDAYVKSLVALSKSPEIKGRMLLVAASDLSNGHDTFASSFSNYPADERDGEWVITAPGENILSEGAGGLPVIKGGTSMATPIVTGVAALVKARLIEKLGTPDIKPEIVFDAMLSSARLESMEHSRRFDYKFGRGIVNPQRALEMVDRKLEQYREWNAVPEPGHTSEPKKSLLSRIWRK